MGDGKNAFDLMQDGNVLAETQKAIDVGADFDHDGEVSLFERRLAGGRAVLEANPLLAWSIEDSLTLSPFGGRDELIESRSNLMNTFRRGRPSRESVFCANPPPLNNRFRKMLFHRQENSAHFKR